MVVIVFFCDVLHGSGLLWWWMTWEAVSGGASSSNSKARYRGSCRHIGCVHPELSLLLKCFFVFWNQKASTGHRKVLGRYTPARKTTLARKIRYIKSAHKAFRHTTVQWYESMFWDIIYKEWHSSKEMAWNSSLGKIAWKIALELLSWLVMVGATYSYMCSRSVEVSGLISFFHIVSPAGWRSHPTLHTGKDYTVLEHHNQTASQGLCWKLSETWCRRNSTSHAWGNLGS